MRGIERIESVQLEDVPEPSNDHLPQDHLFRQVIAESFEIEGFRIDGVELSLGPYFRISKTTCSISGRIASHRETNRIARPGQGENCGRDHRTGSCP